MASTFTYIAYIATALFIIKLCLMLIDFDHDEIDAHFDSDDAFSILSFQSVFAFFMGFGWLGRAATTEWGFNSIASVFVACIFGIIVMLVYAFTIKFIHKLNSVKEFNLSDCIGQTGTTYTSIPEKGLGQVEISFQGKRQIMDAKSVDGIPINIDAQITVSEIQNKILVVKKI